MSGKLEYIVDENGKWLINNDGTKDLIEPAESLWQKWQEEANRPSIVDPTQEEINIDFDYRLSLVELGLQ